MKKQGNLIIACLAAAAAGVAIGMLIAPEKGEDLRNKIKKSMGDWASKLSSDESNHKTTASNEVVE